MKENYETPLISTMKLDSETFFATSLGAGGDGGQWGSLMCTSSSIWEERK